MKEIAVTLRISKEITRIMTVPDNADAYSIRALADQLANDEFHKNEKIDMVDVMSYREITPQEK